MPHPGDRGGESGFTLLELMIAVAIIGVLAAIAVPAFSRYVKKSRTAEVPEYMAKIVAGATVYYEVDHVNVMGDILPKQFPETTTKEKRCCLYPEKICPAEAPQYQTQQWRALNFRIDRPHYFRPDFYSGGTGLAATFTVEVYGDLDCDEIWSTFRRTGGIDSEGGVRVSAGMYVVNELE